MSTPTDVFLQPNFTEVTESSSDLYFTQNPILDLSSVICVKDPKVDKFVSGNIIKGRSSKGVNNVN